jgi:AsmA protein
MKKAVKWLLIIVGGLVALVIAALIIIPMFVDMEKFKPQIEAKVEEATGRPFAIDGELELSLFPWAGIAFSDLHFGNPPGFKEKEFVYVKSFEVKVKLIPLITKEIQVKKFVAEGPRIVLIKDRNGRTNWEGMGKPKGLEPKKDTDAKKETETKEEGLPITSIDVDEFALKNGSLVFIDQSKGKQNEISDLNLYLEDVSLDKPLKIIFSTKIDGNPLSLNGMVGPLGKDPGKGTIPLDIVVNALEEIKVGIKGSVVDPSSNLSFDMSLDVSPFSPRKIFSKLGKKFPVATSDPDTLKHVALKAGLKGTKNKVSISGGKIELDDSNIDFEIKAGEFNKPDVNFKVHLDKIDVDRYLPPEKEEKAKRKKGEEPKKPGAKGSKPDYTPLRKLVLAGEMVIEELKAKGAKLHDVKLKVTGRNGIFHLDPLTVNLYEGTMKTKGRLDVSRDTPQSAMNVHAEGIQIGPLVKDVMKKEIIEGTFKTDLDVRMRGDDADAIKQSLNGNGNMVFRDGALIGIDLDGMLRNVETAFGKDEKAKSRARTDFSEIKSVFTIKNGLVNTKETTMASPVLRAFVEGDANLVNEALDLRIEPKFVATIKGQGDTEKRKGIVVPIKVTGTFSSPEFRPDLEGTLKKGIKDVISDPKNIEKLLDTKSDSKERKEELKDIGKGLLKNFISDE